MRQAILGEALSSPFAERDDESNVVELSEYLNGYVLPVCRNTPDFGLLAMVLNGQAEEWEARIGRWPLAVECAALCRLALSAVETRVRAKLAEIEPQLTRFDMHYTVRA